MSGPSSELEPPHPVPQGSVSAPRNQRRWDHTRLRVRGWGGPNSYDWRKSLALCLWSKLLTTGMHLGVRHGGKTFIGPLFISALWPSLCRSTVNIWRMCSTEYKLLKLDEGKRTIPCLASSVRTSGCSYTYIQYIEVDELACIK